MVPVLVVVVAVVGVVVVDVVIVMNALRRRHHPAREPWMGWNQGIPNFRLGPPHSG